MKKFLICTIGILLLIALVSLLGSCEASAQDIQTQWKQSVEQKEKMELKHKVVGAILLIGTMYTLREDLTEFSFKHNKVAYFALMYSVSEIFGWKVAIGAMLGREITQLETWPELLGDSVTDVLAGGLGIFISVKL
jgi:hypothetical protein